MSQEEVPCKRMKISSQKGREELEEEWREVFQIFDIDRNGKVSATELGTLLRGLGYSPSLSDLHDMIHKIDKNKTGFVEWEEFTELMWNMKLASAQEQRQEMIRAFQIFDYNGDGHIDAKELERVMTTTGEKLTHEELKQMISVADIDQDGHINYKEFVNFIFSERT